MTALYAATTVLALLAALCWYRRVRHLEALAIRLGAQLDEAHLAAAALSVDHGSPAVWRRRAQSALRAGELTDRRRIADACAAVAAHGARELERHAHAAERSLADALGPHCSDCGNAIDEDWCHCGSAVAGHGQGDGHAPVPMGCTCGYDGMERDWKKIAEARHLIAWRLRDERDSARGWLARTVQIARGLRAQRLRGAP